MKRAASVLLILLMLPGCANSRNHIDRMMGLRGELLASESCCFTASVTADYGDRVHEFRMDCAGDSQGNLTFSVTAPESIAGITGSISSGGGKLTFDDTALTFPLLADGQVAPVTAPWIFLKTLRGGYLTSAGEEGELLRVTVDDTYEEDALHLDIWLNEADKPVQADILYDGRRILSIVLENFEIR